MILRSCLDPAENCIVTILNRALVKRLTPGRVSRINVMGPRKGGYRHNDWRCRPPRRAAEYLIQKRTKTVFVGAAKKKNRGDAHKD